MKNQFNDTIVAVSTPLGRGALSIVRLTGPAALEISGKIFYKGNVLSFPSHTIHYGQIRDGNKVIDEVMLAVMRAPRSYTGEDIVEITCHGGVFIASKIISLFSKSGARVANPGEFTKRAFLNGKMDLSQAESVIRLINANSERAHSEAIKIFNGDLKEKVENIKEKILNIKAEIDADIEWGETEPIDTGQKIEKIEILKETERQLAEIIENSQNSKQLMAGFNVVICGMPNAGKSSLFNCILNMSKSIVFKTPGTTRDVIETEIVLNGFLVNLVDTAGIGLDNASEIEKIAIYKSREAIKSADIIIYVINAESRLDKKNYEIKKLFFKNNWIPVINKCDLKKNIKNKEFLKFCAPVKPTEISCCENWGIDDIKKKVIKILRGYESDKFLLSCRQRESFKNALNTIDNAVENLNCEKYSELISFDLQESIKFLGEIDGSILNEDILDRIFSTFCIGK